MMKLKILIIISLLLSNGSLKSKTFSFINDTLKPSFKSNYSIKECNYFKYENIVISDYYLIFDLSDPIIFNHLNNKYKIFILNPNYDKLESENIQKDNLNSLIVIMDNYENTKKLYNVTINDEIVLNYTDEQYNPLRRLTRNKFGFYINYEIGNHNKSFIKCYFNFHKNNFYLSKIIIDKYIINDIIKTKVINFKYSKKQTVKNLKMNLYAIIDATTK